MPVAPATSLARRRKHGRPGRSWRPDGGVGVPPARPARRPPARTPPARPARRLPAPRRPPPAGRPHAGSPYAAPHAGRPRRPLRSARTRAPLPHVGAPTEASPAAGRDDPAPLPHVACAVGGPARAPRSGVCPPTTDAIHGKNPSSARTTGRTRRLAASAPVRADFWDSFPTSRRAPTQARAGGREQAPVEVSDHLRGAREPRPPRRRQGDGDPPIPPADPSAAGGTQRDVPGRCCAEAGAGSRSPGRWPWSGGALAEPGGHLGG
jgi:hypothetical protein